MRSPDPIPSQWQLFRIWGRIGLQSFGGGSSTLFLIQDEFIEKHGWLTTDDFSIFWNLCLFTPGINIIALTVLIGRKLGGTRGIVASLIGLLLPSATITCLIAAGFKLVQNRPETQAILRGVVPATAGVMFLVAIRFAQPLLILIRKEGWWRLTISAAIILGCAIALIFLQLSVIIVLICAALAGTIIFTSWRTASPPLATAHAAPLPALAQEHDPECSLTPTTDQTREEQ